MCDWRFDRCSDVTFREHVGIVVSKAEDDEIVVIIPASERFILGKTFAWEPVTDDGVVLKVLVKAGLVPPC